MGNEKITIKEAAALTGYSENTLQRACRSGEIQAVKVGKVWQVDRADAIFFGSRHPYRDGITRSRPVTTDAEALPAEQLTLEAVLPTDEVKDWMKEKAFSYEDLLEQYRRGFAIGWNMAHDSHE